MFNIFIGDRVQIIEVKKGEEHYLYKTGRVRMIADDNYVIQLDNGDGFEAKENQLKKID